MPQQLRFEPNRESMGRGDEGGTTRGIGRVVFTACQVGLSAAVTRCGPHLGSWRSQGRGRARVSRGCKNWNQTRPTGRNFRRGRPLYISRRMCTMHAEEASRWLGLLTCWLTRLNHAQIFHFDPDLDPAPDNGCPSGNAAPLRTRSAAGSCGGGARDRGCFQCQLSAARYLHAQYQQLAEREGYGIAARGMAAGGQRWLMWGNGASLGCVWPSQAYGSEWCSAQKGLTHDCVTMSGVMALRSTLGKP